MQHNFAFCNVQNSKGQNPACDDEKLLVCCVQLK